MTAIKKPKPKSSVTNQKKSEQPKQEEASEEGVKKIAVPVQQHFGLNGVHWVVKDVLLLGSLGLAVFLFLILFSYDSQDPAFDSTRVVQHIHNYGGKTGAWLSSALFYILGVMALLLPFGLVLASWVALKSNQGMAADAPKDYSRFVISLLGTVLFVIAGSALATLFLIPPVLGVAMPFSAGGVLGYELSQGTVKGLDLLGATLLLLVVLALAISMMLNQSWLKIFEGTGEITELIYLKVKPYLMKGFQKIRQKIHQKVEEQSEQTEEKKLSELEVEEKQRKMHKHPLKLVIPTLKKKPVEQALDKKLKQEEKVAESEVALKVGSRETAESVQISGSLLSSTGILPSLDLLDEPPSYEEGFSEEQLRDLSFLLEQKLEEFGISVKVESVQPGPVVTRFEILPAPGVKVSQINNLSKDLARVLSVKSVRVVDIIPGKAVIGIEIPNEERELVSFREILASEAFQNSPSKLTVALGKDIAGKPVVADIAKMPHLLVAGTTGAGKSVGVNSMILSLLYKATPEEVRLIMVDPKMLELSVYDDIPHLLTPVVTDMSEAANALRWCVFEMDRRYQLMAKLGVRNIAGFNAKVQGAIDAGEPIVDPLYQQMASFGMEQAEAPPTLTPLPFIVVVVDEFADMIMVVGKEVEQLIARIAQKARAAGIHLILATQRPSVNVITGLIKANIPTRISFMVNTKIDSRTILDQGGAEQLLGMGDMLYMPPGTGTPMRVHGAFVSDEEVHRVVDFVKQQGEPQYLETITKMGSENESEASGGGDAEQDPIYDEAVAFVAEKRRVSISLIQRQFKIGYNRAARIVEAMESAGLISKPGSGGNREILIPSE